MNSNHVEVSDFQKLPRQPKVSIVVLAYRHELYLEQAVESLVRQRTSYPYEIVIGEDCSPDRTREIALELQRRHPDLVRVVYSDRNKGMNPNFRFTLGFCRGEYMAGCEGDDFWTDDEKLERQIAALEKLPGVDMAFTQGHAIMPDGTAVLGCDYGPTARVIPPAELFSGIAWIAPTASVVIRTDVVRALPEWLDAAPVGDVFLFLAGSSRGGAYYEPVSTIGYRVAQPTSFTVTHQERSAAERIAYFEGMVDLIERTCDHYRVPRRVVGDRLSDFRLQLAKLYGTQGRRMLALLTVLRMRPSYVAKGLARRSMRMLSGTRNGPSSAGAA